MITTHLYNPTDTKVVRKCLLSEQSSKDALTGFKLEDKDAVLDHNHETQFVRGVLHRQANVLLGKIENAFIRYMKWWYPGTLQDFLRKAADYLDKGDDRRYTHPGWIRASQVEFNKLKEGNKKEVLAALGMPTGSNPAERKESFKKALLTRQHTFDKILGVIHDSKGNN